MPIQVRAVSEAELPAWFEAASTVFFMWPWGDSQAAAEFRRPHMDLDRTMGAFDGDTIVGTYRTFAVDLTVPGRRSVPASALSAVTVRSTHRRRGVLSSFVVDDIARVGGRGEPVGILFAAEWPIYGRFGYGPASWEATWAIRARAARFRHEPAGSIDVVTPKAAREILPKVYARHLARQAGEISRIDLRWDTDLGLVQPPGRPKWAGVVAIHRDPDGAPDGYATYHGEEKWTEGIPDNVLILDELHAASEAAEIDLWSYLCSIDLVATVKARSRRVRERFPWYLEDARAARVVDVDEGLWLRIYDVPAALVGRAYERSDRLVIDVVDRLADAAGPGAGRYELDASPDGVSCRRSRRSPDLRLDVAALGAAYLGGTRLVDAVRAGGAEEGTPGALARADDLFRTADEPWCTTHF